MRETSFIQQNKDKWREFEQRMDGQHKDPEKLNELFIQITDDLSYSRTFYPNRSVRVYLNGLAQRIFFSIYKNRKSRSSRLISFWTDELPQLVYQARREFLFSFLIFVLACGIGALSSYMDPEFPSIILGQDYVDMTLENIQSGDPMAVYKQKGRFGMTLGIAANNIFVAFLTFVTGIFFTLGTISVLISNGVMLGTFQYFFIERGLFLESFLSIWIHGTLEISAIIIAGAAGMTMGKGLVFPGTYTRLQSFQRSARRGVKIMIGIVPIIALAGFFEGYLTRQTETPDFVRALFILGCLAFVLFYFVWYPRYRARHGFRTEIRETALPPEKEQQLDLSRIRSSGEIFSEIFVFFRKHLQRIAVLTLGTTTVYTLTIFLLSKQAPDELFSFPNQFLGAIAVLGQFFNNEENQWLFSGANLLVYTFLALTTFRLFKKDIDLNGESEAVKDRVLFAYLRLLPAMLLLITVIATNLWYTIFLLLAVMPVAMVWSMASFVGKRNLLGEFRRSLGLLSNNFGRAIGLYTILLLVAFLFYSIMDTALFMFYFQIIGLVVHFEQEIMNQISAIVLTFISIYFLHLIFIMILTGSALLFYTLLEIREAPALKERIRQIGQARKIRGLEKE